MYYKIYLYFKVNKKMSRKKLTVIFTLIAILIIQLFTSVSAQETTTNKTEVNTQTIIDKLTAEGIERLSDKHTAGTAGPEQFKERLTKKSMNHMISKMEGDLRCLRRKNGLWYWPLQSLWHWESPPLPRPVLLVTGIPVVLLFRIIVLCRLQNR